MSGSPFPINSNPPSCPVDQPLGAATDPQFPLLFLSFKHGLGGNCGVPLEAYHIDKISGSLTNAVEGPHIGGPGLGPAVAVDSSGALVYFQDASTNSLGVWALDLRSATLTGQNGSGEGLLGNTLPTVALQVIK